MKNNLTIWVIFIGTILGLHAQEYYNRPPRAQEQRKLAGATSFVQDELLRSKTPKIVETSLYYGATNYSDGLIFVKTNTTVVVHIELPNPTNALNRRYEIHTMGACTVVLTNRQVTTSYTDTFTMTNTTTSYFIQSNKTAQAYSTGTNWLVRLY